MTKVGAGAAGLQLSYNPDNLDPTMQFWGANLGRKQGERAAAQKAEKDAKGKRIEQWAKDNKFDPKEFESPYSGYTSTDEVVRDTAQQFKKEYLRIRREIIDKGLTGEALEEAENAMYGVLDEVKRFNQTYAQTIADRVKETKEAYEDGTLSGVNGSVDDVIQSIADHNFRFRYVDNNLTMTGVTRNDDVYYIPGSDFLNGEFRIHKKIDLNKEADTISLQIGETLNKGIGEGMTIESKLWNEKIQGDSARKQIDAFLSNDYNIAEVYYQALLKKGKKSNQLKGFSDNQKKIASDHLYNLVKSSYDTKYMKNPISKSDRTYGFGYDKDGKLLASPILDPETGNLGYQPITIGGKPVTQGYGYNLDTTARKKLKTLFENEPNTIPSAILIGEDDDLYVRVSEQGSDRREVDEEDDSTSEIEELAKQADVPLTTDSKRKPIKKRYQYRRLDNTRGTAVAGALNAESIIDLKNRIKALPETYGLPTNIKGQDQGIGTKRTFGQGISSVDTPLPEGARAVTRTVDGETSLIEGGQPMQSTNSDPLGLGI